MQKTTEELVFLEFEARQSLTVISAPPPSPGTNLRSICVSQWPKYMYQGFIHTAFSAVISNTLLIRRVSSYHEINL